jgi:ribosomal protein S11
LYKNKYLIKKSKVVRGRGKNFKVKLKNNLLKVSSKNYDRLLVLAKYVQLVNMLPRKKVNLHIKNIKLLKKMKKKIISKKMLFKFINSKRKLKKLYFRIKRIARKKQIKIKRKYFRKKVCLVMFKKTNKNFFVIVTDIKGKVITYCSAGMFSNSTNSKKKNSIFLINFMMYNIVNRIRSLKIKTLRLVFKSNISKHVHQAIRYLNKFKFKIEHVAFLKPIPHHAGQRRKKLKRL